MLDPWVLGLLEKLRELILALTAQLEALEVELMARVKDMPRPKSNGPAQLNAATPVCLVQFTRLSMEADHDNKWGKDTL